MTSREHIRNPIEWTADQLWLASLTVGSLGHSVWGSRDIALPAGCRIKAADLKDGLRGGFGGFWGLRVRRYLHLPHLPACGPCAGVADLRLPAFAAIVSARVRLRAGRPGCSGRPL